MYEFNPARKYFIYAFKNRSFKAKIDSKILDAENIAYWAGVARKDAEQLNNDDVKKNRIRSHRSSAPPMQRALL
jgi:hypothetical protein